MIPCYRLHQHPCAVWFQRSKDVLSGTSRISQIMQYVKERDEIEIFGSIVFGRGDLEGCVFRNAIPRACIAACSSEPEWKSYPMKLDFGNAFAMSTVEKPVPHPTSATEAPRFSLGTTPSSAGSHFDTMFAAYRGRSILPIARNIHPACLPHATPLPVLNAAPTSS